MDRLLTTSGKLFARPSKNSQLEPVKVDLTADTLCVFRHDMIYEDVLANQKANDERDLLLERGEEGLGFSIQGGLEFKCPIKVYKVFPGSVAERSGLDENDTIFEVNGTPLWGKTHEEAAHFMKNIGTQVQLHVAKLTLREIDEQQPIVDKWLKMVEIPLKMASVTRYQQGTANLQPDRIQVVSKDGRSKVTLHCTEDTSLFLTEYLTAIEARINRLIKIEMEKYNGVLDKDDRDRVLLMGWVSEYLPSAANAKVWQRKFLVLRNFRLQLYNIPPEEIREWARPEKSYKLVEMSMQLKEPHSFLNQRANSVVITTGQGVNHIISFENLVQCSQWTKQIHDTTVNAVLRLQRQQFLAEWRDHYVHFVLDIERGFLICSREDSSHVLWSQPFSALKRSSDDGHSKLRLSCRDRDTQVTGVQEIELEDLQAAVCCMECFLVAKVATLDSHFASQLDFVA